MKLQGLRHSPTFNVSHTALFLFALVIVANTLYVTSVSRGDVLTSGRTSGSTAHEPVVPPNLVPDVVIFRKTKKTGSTSGLDAIMRGLILEGYIVLHNHSNVMEDIVRAEAHRPSPRKLFVAHHNAISRAHTGNLFTVITDTVKDGFQQMTSFCRYFSKVKECDSDEMRACLRSWKGQNWYRWAGRRKEDSETYIDLPLSSAHPALSTTVFRRVFPNITLDFPRNNALGSSCEEIPSIRKVYDEIYSELDLQVLKLRKRMLTLAGYPSEVQGYSIVQLLDAAERAEQTKYNLSRHKPTKQFGEMVDNARVTTRDWGWYISKDGKLLLKDVEFESNGRYMRHL